MLKRDPIFYVACAVCAIGLAVALMGHEVALLLFVAAYLLRPVVHEIGLGQRYADERQLTIHARSGNISFIAVILAAVGFALWRVSRGERADQFYELICIGLAARAIAGLVMGGEYRRAGAVIIGAIGVFLGLFVIVDAGLGIGAVVGLAIAGLFVGIARISLFYPRCIASFAMLIIVALFVADLHEFRSGDTALWLFIVTPLAFASACLLLGSTTDDNGVSPKLRTAVFGSLAGCVAIVFTLLVLFGDRGNEDSVGGATTTVAAGEVREIQGVPCTGMVDTYANGNLESCALAHDAAVVGQVLPVGTIVSFTPDADFSWCFLPRDTEIQGHLCRGPGHNFMTGFYPDGTLRLAWLARDEEIDGIPCSEFRFLAAFSRGGGGTRFHPNGRLKQARLSRDFVIEGRQFSRNDVIDLDPDGRLVTANSG